MIKFCFFVPESHLESVKSAVFAEGAGQIGDYESCCWQTLGTGQFKAMASANPFIGEVGELEKVEEWKVEMVVEETKMPSVMTAFLAAHPYEEPAYECFQIYEWNT